MSDDVTARAMTLDEANALVGDDISYWLNNPFVDRNALAGKVCWWIERAAAAAEQRGRVAALGEAGQLVRDHLFGQVDAERVAAFLDSRAQRLRELVDREDAP